jgi:hypothetical protein
MSDDDAAYRGLVVLVPTRNRSHLAITAIRSVLEERRHDIQVLVSDNSTEPEETARLRRFCESSSERCLRYIRPDQPLSMSLHYDWVLQRALELYSQNHFTILTDRFVFRRGALTELSQSASNFPNNAIVFLYDSVYDHRVPCTVFLSPWSGKTYRCKTADILKAIARMGKFELVPVLLNSVITRSILHQLKQRFGDYCVSIAPDFCCGFRTLAVEEDVVFLDKALSINWGRSRSNGFSFTRGVITKDSRAFTNDLGGRVEYAATPIPEITTTMNAILHEYLLLKQVSHNDKFVDLSMKDYLKWLRIEVAWMENGELKKRFSELLNRHSAVEPEAEDTPAPWNSPAFGPLPPTLKNRIKNALVNESTRPIWWHLYRHLGIKLPARHRNRFPSGEQALYYALNNRHDCMDGETRGLPEWSVEVDLIREGHHEVARHS